MTLKYFLVDYSLSRIVWKVTQKSVQTAWSLKAAQASSICQAELSPTSFLMPILDKKSGDFNSLQV